MVSVRLSKVRFRDYALRSFVGMLPVGFMDATLGSLLTRIASVQLAVACDALPTRRDTAHE